MHLGVAVESLLHHHLQHLWGIASWEVLGLDMMLLLLLAVGGWLQVEHPRRVEELQAWHASPVPSRECAHHGSEGLHVASGAHVGLELTCSTKQLQWLFFQKPCLKCNARSLWARSSLQELHACLCRR